MGNTCVHMGSHCVESKSSKDGFCQPVFKSPWVQQTDLVMDHAQKQHQIGSNGKQSGGDKEAKSLSRLPNKPPEQMIISKEEKPIKKQETEPTQQMKQIQVTVKPAAVSEKPRKPENFTRLSSVGLQTESVLKTKTGHLKEYYNLGPKLGHGQYGTTFLCVEKRTGKEYACKSITKRKLADEDDVDDVRREIEIMHHLSSQPNVILIKGAYEDSVAVHVVMELCKGGELFDRIVAKGHYDERKAAMLARAIVGVVKNCHCLGVMHRDLKPENFLFVDEQEESPIKAIDFGLSVYFKPGDKFTDVVGSPYYVAPEVLLKSYGPEADVWSAGVMIYVLLCGEPPFLGETEDEIFDKVLHSNIDFSSNPWPEISESAKDLIKKMLDRDTKNRLTADQVLRHPWIQDEGIASDTPLDLQS